MLYCLWNLIVELWVNIVNAWNKADYEDDGEYFIYCNSKQNHV